MIAEIIDLSKYTPIYPEYKCMKCKHEWKASRFGSIECVNCGDIYVEWMNVNESLKSIGSK